MLNNKFKIKTTIGHKASTSQVRFHSATVTSTV